MESISSLSMQVYLFVVFFTFVTSSSLRMDRRQDVFLKTMEAFRSSGSEAVLHTHKPIRVTRSGEFVDFASLDGLSQISNDGSVRHRRSNGQRDVRDKLDASTATQDGNHEVFFDLGHAPSSPLSGARLHLKRNYKLVSENFIVEERGRGGKVVGRHSTLHECHYTGVIHNHDSFSKVALSLCNGLQGIILKNDDTFFIEPLWNHSIANRTEAFVSTSSPLNDLPDEEGSHPHIIVKRSVLEHLSERRKNKKDLGHCGYTDKVSGAIPWWRIDPRETTRNANDDYENKSGANMSTEDESLDLKTGKLHKHHRSHHHNHRTATGRSQTLSEKGLERKRRSSEKEEKANTRKRRSVSLERNVETLVVADKTLVGYHGRQEVERYILTIMNIVASLYHEASVGNAVNIIVTRIILLTADQANLEINHHADRSLNSFCNWQSGINVNGTSSTSDSGLAHHDNAVLLTGFDICTDKDEPCGTLGLAPVAGMCEAGRSCNINEDIGLASAFTIAHEIGHNFGMKHDGTGNDCAADNDSPSQIMAAQLTKNTSPFTWSRCSRKYISDFLDSGAGDCLINNPTLRDFAYPEEMPGQMHDADEQCRFQYGAQSRQCKIGDPCRELWCLSKTGRCVTNSVPAAEGTSCSTDTILNGWCYRGDCIMFGYRADAVDGDWGSWTSWAECSRSCGTGVSSSYRSCDNPAPEHGGKYCIGERMRFRTCNVHDCTNASTDFRHEQCARFDNEPFRGKYYNWLPFVGGEEAKPCALNCLAQGYNFYAERAPSVVDGTRCFANSLDMCINGECHHVGCDDVLHSEAVEDKCRVCGGDGSTCRTEAGVFNHPVLHGQYHEVVTIPRGSVNIFIEELEVSVQNYIALKSSADLSYINGDWTIDWPREFKIAGTTFSYERRSNELESLKALGPTTEDLVIMVLLQEPNRGIKYEFNVPIERQGSGGSESAFLWDHEDWTPCSASCAGGSQRRPVICKRVDDDTVVQHSYCDQTTMPVEKEQSCNMEPCPAMWSASSWSECSRTCGGGHRTRSVICARKMTQLEEETVDHRYCAGTRPPATDACNIKTCPPQWYTDGWSVCKPSCGNGFKTRTVHCMSGDRRIRYSNESKCDVMLKPDTKIRCSNRPCPPARWLVGKWGTCSVDCGRGLKRRRVVCASQKVMRHPSECSHIPHKPSSTKSCEAPCNHPSVPAEQCVDDEKVGYCPLVKKFKFCRRAYFKKLCCHTCSMS